ncbi:unnamed protein product [Peronospora farinosa]|uniref:Complex 1 LYR protein domain-containing protein n=1 Tax=Peronospora farinosa TaxID=134698 RepID=A0ABN8BY13_9STRA|nr:unnamed protein product [Peronospora farinosa]
MALIMGSASCCDLNHIDLMAAPGGYSENEARWKASYCTLKMGKVKVHSGLQLQVMILYKKVLQAAKRKDIDTLRYVRERFREDVTTVDRKDFAVIEYMLRKGERDLKMLDRMKSVHFTNVSPQK